MFTCILLSIAATTRPKSVIPPQSSLPRSRNNNFVPNLAEAGLRNNNVQQQRPTSRPQTTQAPRTLPPPRPVAQPPRSRPQTTRPQQPQQTITQNQFSRPQQNTFPQQPPRRVQQSQFSNSRNQQTQFPQFSQFGNQQGQQTQFGRGQQTTQQQFSQQPRRGGFTSQQLDIIRNGVTRLNGFGGQQQQPQQSQNTIPQSQPRRINQQSSRTQTVSRPQTPVRTTSRPVQTPPRPT